MSLKQVFQKVFEIFENSMKAQSTTKSMLAWVSASGGRGAVPPLDFHTWYRYRSLIVLFFGIFCYFSVFFFGKVQQGTTMYDKKVCRSLSRSPFNSSQKEQNCRTLSRFIADKLSTSETAPC